MFLLSCRLHIVPADTFAGSRISLSVVKKVSKAAGLFMMVLFLVTPFLEGVSAILTSPATQYSANALMTTSYSLWIIFLFVTGTSLAVVGLKIVLTLQKEVAVHREKGTASSKTALELKKVLIIVRSSVLGSTTITFGSLLPIFVLCVFRYYIWSSRPWNMLLMYTLIMNPVVIGAGWTVFVTLRSGALFSFVQRNSLHIFIFCLFLFAHRDIRLKMVVATADNYPNP